MIDRLTLPDQFSGPAVGSRPLIGRHFVALSLLVHLLVFALLPGGPGAFNPAPRPLPLTIRLSSLLTPASQPAIAAPLPASRQSEASSRSRPPAGVAPPAPPSIKLSTDAASPATTPAPPDTPTAMLTPPVASLAIESTTAALAKSSTTAITTVSAEPRERRGKPSTLWLAEYTEALSGQVGRVKQYPAIARLRGWQGTTIVAIRLAADGAIVDTRISQSSGHEILDRQALAMVRQAEPLPPLPEPGSREPLLVQLPIVFALAPRE